MGWTMGLEPSLAEVTNPLTSPISRTATDRDHIKQSIPVRHRAFNRTTKNGVDDGTRTHDDRDHNPGLYQLSYAHH